MTKISQMKSTLKRKTFFKQENNRLKAESAFTKNYTVLWHQRHSLILFCQIYKLKKTI